MGSLVGGVAFSSSSYNFSLPENQPAGVLVGQVWASTGSDLVGVAYGLKRHADVFSVNASGAIVTRAALDREQLEWFILDVEAVDTRSPPTTAVAVVRPDPPLPRPSQRGFWDCGLVCVLQVSVQVEDVSEPPQFPHPQYKASVLSIAPYRTPVITVRVNSSSVGRVKG